MSLLKIAIHPGRILQDEYLAPANLSAGKLAKILGVPRTRIERLVAGSTAMTTDTALRLAACFETSPQYWLNMQVNYDIATADMSAFDTIQPAFA